jgi:hypothetical protein
MNETEVEICAHDWYTVMSCRMDRVSADWEKRSTGKKMQAISQSLQQCLTCHVFSLNGLILIPQPKQEP